MPSNRVDVRGVVPAALSYEIPGETDPGVDTWSRFPRGFLRFERTVTIGEGDEAWSHASREVMHWGVKRRSGFRVDSNLAVAVGAEYVIEAGWGRWVVREPVRVVAVVDDDDRRGFAYGTLYGHPVSGEEAFVVHRDGSGAVYFTLRSLTRAAPNGPWRQLFPALLAAQLIVRRRYLRALSP